MSLRAFHVLFIVLSIAMSAFVGAWGFNRYRAGEGAEGLILAVVFFVFGLALVVYGARYFAKLKELGR